MTHHYAACAPCCDGPPREPLDCDELPTSLSVSWSGAFKILHARCSDFSCTSQYFVGAVESPSTASGTVSLFSAPPSCVYFPGFEVSRSNAVGIYDCNDDSLLVTCNIEAIVAVNPPVANASGPYAGFWTVVVEIFGTTDCDTGGISCLCPFYTSESVTFVGPPTWQSPVGTYLPVAGATWNPGLFPCDGGSVLADTPGSVSVS
jgi:hypothetical protein